MKVQEAKNGLRHWLPAIIAVLVTGGLLLVFPERTSAFTGTALEYAMEMVTVLPAVLILMGIMTVTVSNEFISRYLGSAAGLRGVLMAFLLGTLPTGPLYIAFPFAATLKKKGAGTGNIVVFLSTWACIKLPQELVELRFLGAGFMVARLSLTILAVAGMALLMDRILKKEENRGDIRS